MKDHPSTDTAATTAKGEEDAVFLQSEIAEGLRTEVGLLPEFANEWAARIMRRLRLRAPAQRLYIPAPSKTERDAAIYREHDGTNTGALCQRYGISRPRLYQICEEQRELARQRSPV